MKVFDKLSRDDYKAANIEPSETLRKEVEAIRKRPRSTSAKAVTIAPKNASVDKITTLSEVLERKRRATRSTESRLSRPTIHRATSTRPMAV